MCANVQDSHNLTHFGYQLVQSLLSMTHKGSDAETASYRTINLVHFLSQKILRSQLILTIHILIESKCK